MLRFAAVACLVLFAAVVIPVVGRAQAPDAERKARATAFFEALASGSAARFEAMAGENFTAAHLARQSPERRRVLFDRIQSDFGPLTLTSIELEPAGAVLNLRGATGFVGRCDLDIERTPPYRIVGLLLKSGPGADPTAAPVIDASMSAEALGNALDAYFAPLVRSDTFAGVVLIAKDGFSVVAKAYGSADREARAPVALQTRFNVGSIGKVFTKAAIAQLAIEGKLALTDTVGKLLPDYPNKQTLTATVAQLLNHQVGVADFFGPEFAATPKTQFRSNADYYRFVAGRPLVFAPGAKTEYCNGCYIVLGAIIERLAGVPYEQYVSEKVFKPAGIRTAGFFQSDQFPPDVAVGYTLRAPASPKVLHSNTQLLGAAGSAAGGVYAAAADVLAFDTALREGRLLDSKMTAWVLEARDEGVKGRRASGELLYTGGAPGINALLQSDGLWTVVVASNLDPPTAEQAGVGIMKQLHR